VIHLLFILFICSVNCSSSLLIEEYDATLYNNLVSPEDATVSITEKDGSHPIITELLLLIEKYHLQHKITVQLLHRHFDQDENSILVERQEGNELITEPTMLTERKNLINRGELVPTIFQAVRQMESNKNGSGIYYYNYYPLQYAFTRERILKNEAKSLLEVPTSFLFDLGEILYKRKAYLTVGFGLVVQSSLYSMTDSVLLENNPESKRQSVIQTIPRSLFHPEENQITSWQLRKGVSLKNMLESENVEIIYHEAAKTWCPGMFCKKGKQNDNEEKKEDSVYREAAKTWCPGMFCKKGKQNDNEEKKEDGDVKN